MSLSEVSEQQHMKLKASMEQQWNKSYKTHEAQSDLSKTATPIYQPYPVIPVRTTNSNSKCSQNQTSSLPQNTP